MIYLSLIILNLVVFFSFTKITKIINIYDNPDGKLKVHLNRIPLIGGILLFFNLVLICFIQLTFIEEFLMLKKTHYLKNELVSLCIFITALFMLGLYDDKFKINPYNKLLLIVLLSIFVLSINKNLVVENFSLSFYDDRIFLNNFSFFFTIFCILILLNALNFYDGVNGQSGIFYIFIFSFLYYVSHFHDFYLYLILILLFILILNLKNKLFFGDSGIYLISSILVISLIYEYNITKNILYADEIFFLFLLPGFDLIRLTFQRIVLKKNILFGDRNHLHHLLVKKGSLINANIILFGLSAFPILAFSYIKSNFYLILVIFLILYFSLLLILDKKHTKKF